MSANDFAAAGRAARKTMSPETAVDGEVEAGIEPSAESRTDVGNGRRFASAANGDARFCHVWDRWLVWDGARFKVDDDGAVVAMAKRTTAGILLEAAAISEIRDTKAHAEFALRSQSRRSIEAMLNLAESEPGIPIRVDDMDPDPWLFNFRNGTLDLRTGRLRPHDRADALTKLCPFDFDPAARSDLWESTVAAVFRDDDELVGFFRRLCGMAMAGSIRDHVLPILWGTGANGKSTLLGALLHAFGPDYAMKTLPRMLAAGRGDAHPTELADLHGKRLVVAIETGEDQRFDEVRVKELTGGDRVRARRLYQESWEFKPTHSIFLATNHEPTVRGGDEGIWRRLKLVPFKAEFRGDDADPDLPAKLESEAGGILAWCVRGCLEWLERGLDEPESVTVATSGYRDEQDVLGAFLDERAVINPGVRVKASALYRSYTDWCEQTGERAVTQTMFGRKLNERGFKKIKSGVVWILGLGLRDGNDEDADSFAETTHAT